MSTNATRWMGLTGLVGLLAMLSVGGHAAEGEGLPPKVTLTLEGVFAERYEENNDVILECRVAIDNATGSELSVRSHFSSIYDGLELVVFDEEGKKLLQRPYTWHQSPHSFTSDRSFPVAKGVNRATLVIPVPDLTPEVRSVKVQMVGVLPGCVPEGVQVSRVLVSHLLDVAIVPHSSMGHLPNPAAVRSFEGKYRDPTNDESVAFKVEPERWQTVLEALVPVRRDENPATWEMLGTLKLGEWDGTQVTIQIYSVVKGPGAFSVEAEGKDRVYYRGGTTAGLLRALREAGKPPVKSKGDSPKS